MHLILMQYMTFILSIYYSALDCACALVHGVISVGHHSICLR